MFLYDRFSNWSSCWFVKAIMEKDKVKTDLTALFTPRQPPMPTKEAVSNWLIDVILLLSNQKSKNNQKFQYSYNISRNIVSEFSVGNQYQRLHRVCNYYEILKWFWKFDDVTPLDQLNFLVNCISCQMNFNLSFDKNTESRI